MTSKIDNPKLRWSQFRLRMFFVLLTVLCVLCGAVAMLLDRAKEQKRAVKWCWEMGGKVSYEDKFVSYGPIEELLGVDAFHKVTDMRFYEGQVSDLTPLAPLTSLRRLSITHRKYEYKDITYHPTQVRDLSPLAELKCLEELTLINSQVSDVTPLSRLQNLRYLNLTGDKVRDLTPLADLKNLRRLHLNNSVANEEEVKKLQESLPNCKIVWRPRQSQASQ